MGEAPKVVRQGCSTCAKARAFLPESIRKRLEEVERRMQAKKDASRPPQK